MGDMLSINGEEISIVEKIIGAFPEFFAWLGEHFPALSTLWKYFPQDFTDFLEGHPIESVIFTAAVLFFGVRIGAKAKRS